MKTILHYGNPTANRSLETPCKQIEFIDRNIHRDIQILHDVLGRFANFAAGLAANQVGLKWNFFCFYDDSDFVRTVINPEIVQSYGEKIEVEGCLSFPNTEVFVKRFSEVKVTYVDFLSMEIITEDLSGFKSKLFQHEIEHLSGKTFIENLSKEEKNEFLARYARNNRPSKDFRGRFRSR